MYKENLERKIIVRLKNALKIYEQMIYEPVFSLQNTEALFTTEHLRSVPESGFSPIKTGSEWGKEWENGWFRGSFTVPAELDGKCLHAISKCGGREQLFFVNGVPKGIFNTKNRDFIGGSHAAQFIKKVSAGEKIELAFECYAGHYDPNTDPYDDYFAPDASQSFNYLFDGVDICTRNDGIFNLIFDIVELIGAFDHLTNSFASAKAKVALLEIAEHLPLFPKDATEEETANGVREALAISRAFFSGGNSRVFGRVGVIGHSHMDTAWLWPVSETIRKCARTYANALHLMEQYPSYRFIQSSALHGQWMKDHYPDIFAEMKKRVSEGRYEPNGGVYVECDCNITSGELMIRQFLKGQQFTRDNFGYTSDSFWLPDTFGYNANIPQIMLGSEIRYFYTTKIFWNELNRFPFESFVWRGIDGSEVITHFNRTHCSPNICDCNAAVRDLSLKDSTDLRLVAYGFGDGGGGPTPGMIEASLRSASTEGMPEVESMTISDFGKELEKQKDKLPVYNDELYLELHRGTLTQMHDVKRKNRKAEYALRDMEYFAVISGNAYHPDSDRYLKTFLKNQFHDILPGTALKCVYDLFNKEMDEVIGFYRERSDAYAKELCKESGGVTLFNTLSFPRKDIAVIDSDGFAGNYPSQRYTDLDGKEVLAVGGLSIPGFASEVIEFSDSPLTCDSPFSYDGQKLETPFATIVFDENGYISSFVDKATKRELRKPDGQPLGTFLFGEDVPQFYDNWDIERDVVRNLKPVHGFVSREIVSDGSVEIRLRSRFKISGETGIVQDLVCYSDIPRVDFETVIDWHSPHRLLKAAFDLDISAKTARSEIQFGSIERPTTENDSVEIAKFEVCNRNFTDISEPGFGASLLNDCKYGISVTGGNLRLSLHKGGTHPDYTGDSGRHKVTYSLLPHSGGFSAENVVRPAYELNVPIFASKGKADVKPLIETEKGNIIAESVKPAEDGSNAFVLRLYECEGTKTTTAVKINAPVSGAVYTNFLEDEKERLELSDGKLSLSFRPFEVKTIKISR